MSSSITISKEQANTIADKIFECYEPNIELVFYSETFGLFSTSFCSEEWSDLVIMPRPNCALGINVKEPEAQQIRATMGEDFYEKVLQIKNAELLPIANKFITRFTEARATNSESQTNEKKALHQRL